MPVLNLYLKSHDIGKMKAFSFHFYIIIATITIPNSSWSLHTYNVNHQWTKQEVEEPQSIFPLSSRIVSWLTEHVHKESWICKCAMKMDCCFGGLQQVYHRDTTESSLPCFKSLYMKNLWNWFLVTASILKAQEDKYSNWKSWMWHSVKKIKKKII